MSSDHDLCHCLAVTLCKCFFIILIPFVSDLVSPDLSPLDFVSASDSDSDEAPALPALAAPAPVAVLVPVPVSVVVSLCEVSKDEYNKVVRFLDILTKHNYLLCYAKAWKSFPLQSCFTLHHRLKIIRKNVLHFILYDNKFWF